MAADPVRNLVYASVNSSSATSPNTVIAIDALQGAVLTTQSLASSPGRIAVSDDGSYLYVALPASYQVRRFTLPSLTPDITWTTPEPVEDIQVAPGQPHTVAVAYASSNQGITAVYDDGVERTSVVQAPYSASFDTVAWGSNASVLYGTSAKGSGGPEYTYTVNQSGVTLSSTFSGVLGDFDPRLSYEASSGRLYDGYGKTINAANGSLVGQFSVQNTLANEPNPFAVDTADSRVFFLNANSTVSGSSGLVEDIQAFDATHFSYINALEIAGLSGGRIVKWGTSGLAVGGGSTIYLIDGSFVSSSGIVSPIGGYAGTSATLTSLSPLSVPAGSGTSTVTITGKNFSQAATVVWNGQTLSSAWQSSTQITATIPASLLTQPVASTLVVTNGLGTEAPNGLPFVVLPALGPNTQITVAAVSGEDMVWDSSRNRLYVAVTNAAAPNGNSIVSVDPSLATVKNIVYTGSQPDVLALSDDSQFLYAGFQKLAAVDRFNVSDFSLNLAIPLTNGGSSASFAGDIKVAPGTPHTIAVSMGTPAIEPRDTGGLVIFDDAVQRPTTQPRGNVDTYKLAWGADATRLYANSDPVFQPQGSVILAVNSSGVSTIAALNGLSYIGLRPHYDPVSNLIYEDGGSVIKPLDGSPAGFLEAGAVVVPDATLNRVFVLHQVSAGSYTLDIYNLARQTLLSSTALPGLVGYPTQMVRWGADGLAVLTDGTPGLLYLLQGSDISGLSTPPAGSIALNPAVVVVGSGSTMVAVTGTKFGSSSAVLVNGSVRPTTVSSSTQLSFQLTAADQSFATYLTVEVSNLTDGTTSPAMSLEIANPVPVISGLSSSSLTAGSAATSITITGAGLVPTSVVAFNGSSRTTTYVSSTQVNVSLPSTDLQTAGTFSITSVNPGPGGGTSGAASLQVLNPVPAITQVAPQIITAGSAAQSSSIYGSGFVASTVVRVNGSARPTTYASSAMVTVSLTAADLASPADLALMAVNTAPGGGTSTVVSLVVSSGIPGAITFSPSVVTQGTTTPTTVAVNGANFEPAAFCRSTA